MATNNILKQIWIITQDLKNEERDRDFSDRINEIIYRMNMQGINIIDIEYHYSSPSYPSVVIKYEITKDQYINGVTSKEYSDYISNGVNDENIGEKVIW